MYTAFNYFGSAFGRINTKPKGMHFVQIVPAFKFAGTNLTKCMRSALKIGVNYNKFSRFTRALV
jgi:hypothetical protein